MRIVHVIDSLSSSGGAENGLVREITRFEGPHDQSVVRLFASDELEPQLDGAGIAVHALGFEASTSGKTWPKAVGRLTRLIEEIRPDVVHTSLFMGNIVGQLAARRSGVPVLSTFVLSGDLSLLRAYQPGADSLKARALRAVARFAARSDRVWFRALTADALVSNCELLGVDQERAVVIPRGVVTPEAPNVKRSDLGLPEGIPLLINVGRHARQKGQTLLLEAFHRVLTEEDAHLLIVGREGESTRDLHRLVDELQIGHHVTLTGHVRDVHRYLSVADVFVFSSLMEGLGTAVIEALAAGLPIVAFDIPPVREATKGGQHAILVESGSADSLGEAILKVLRQPEQGIELGLAGAAWVRQSMSVERIARAVEARLTEVSNK